MAEPLTKNFRFSYLIVRKQTDLFIGKNSCFPIFTRFYGQGFPTAFRECIFKKLIFKKVHGSLRKPPFLLNITFVFAVSLPLVAHGSPRCYIFVREKALRTFPKTARLTRWIFKSVYKISTYTGYVGFSLFWWFLVRPIAYIGKTIKAVGFSLCFPDMI